MNKINYINQTYYGHTIKTLIDKIISDARTDILITKSFHPEKQLNFDDVIFKDNIYVKVISALLAQNISYYIKNLEVIVKESEYKITNLRYNYYTDSEIVAETRIRINYVSNVEQI